MVCKEIVYKNDYANCITNDTGILTVSSALPNEKCTVKETLMASTRFGIKFDYHEAIHEVLEKFDQHLCTYTASIIESKIIESMSKAHRKECFQCIAVFNENEAADDEFIVMKRSTDAALRIPCLSTVHIVIASNKIFRILESQSIETNTTKAYDSILATIMNFLPIEALYTQSEFNLHEQANETPGQLPHHKKFIYKVVNEYQ